MGVFSDLHEFFVKKYHEAQVLSDAAQKICNQVKRKEGETYNPVEDNMGFKNLGWDTKDLANVAGGVEENRDLNESEIVSFYKSLANFLGE